MIWLTSHNVLFLVAGVSEAFDDPLVAHPDLVAFIGDYFKTDDLTSPSMKMAHVCFLSLSLSGSNYTLALY